MSITIMHLRQDADPNVREALMFPVNQEEGRAQAALEALDQGHYEAVAEVDTEDLEEAYSLTQNGVDTASWSMAPDPKVRILGKGYTISQGERLGRKSSAIGDVFIKDDQAYVVAFLGFKKIESWKPEGVPGP